MLRSLIPRAPAAARFAGMPAAFHTSMPRLAWPVNKVGKPVNAYLAFTIAERPKVLKDKPDLSPSEVIAELGERWRGLADSDKESRKAEYRKVFDDWKARAGR